MEGLGKNMIKALNNAQFLESNKLIAEFMGIDKSRIVDKLPTNNKGEYTTLNNKLIYSESLQYHSSWDKLMPVVDKILTDNSSFCNISGPGSLSMTKEWCFDFLTDQTNGNSNYGKTLIEAVYKSVIDYIKWYNKNKKQ